MSAPAQTPTPDAASQAEPTRRTRREQARVGGLIVLAILITLFGVLNLEKVKVDWVLGSGQAPLIIVIVISLLVGILLGHFTALRASKRR